MRPPSSSCARFVCLFLGAFLIAFGTAAARAAAPAHDLPPSDILRSIAEQLPRQPPSRGTSFAPASAAATGPACAMQRFTMTLAAGSDAAHAVPVLLDEKPADAGSPITLLAVVHHVAVDADGSPRTYHPDDPYATGICTAAMGPGGVDRYSGVCALDAFASAHIQLFKGTRRLAKGEFDVDWKSFWPLIRAKAFTPFDLRTYASAAPDGYYFFYWKERDLVALFKRQIVPQTTDGFPCLHHGGYFVAATTLQQDGAAQPDGCTPARFVDPEQVPFFVLPDDAFGIARVGDIVVARSADAPPDRLVFGVVGDTGPLPNFGEGSIAFNQALSGKASPIRSGHDVLELDIHGKVAVLVLGGTKPQLGGDYSRGNIEKVGRAALAQWNGDPAQPTRRLDACLSAGGFK